MVNHVWRGNLKNADNIAHEMVDMLLTDINVVSGARMSALVNSLGATGKKNLYFVSHCKERLESVGVKIAVAITLCY